MMPLSFYVLIFSGLPIGLMAGAGLGMIYSSFGLTRLAQARGKQVQQPWYKHRVVRIGIIPIIVALLFLVAIVCSLAFTMKGPLVDTTIGGLVIVSLLATLGFAAFFIFTNRTHRMLARSRGENMTAQSPQNERPEG